MKLAGKTAIVTGAGRGIGRAIAISLAREGAGVALASRTEADLAETARRIRDAGGRAEAIPADVSRSADVVRLVSRVESALGLPDLVVHSAGIVERARIEDTTPEAWSAVLATNLDAAFHLARAVVPGMRARRRGRIIHVSSISGRLGTAELTAYCASKWGLNGLTKSLAEEVRADGVQVFAVCPGSVDTEMLQKGRPGAKPDMTPDDVANVVLFLASDAPDAMTGALVDVFG